MELYNQGEFRASDDWPYAIAAGCLVYKIDKDSSIKILLLVRRAGDFPEFSDGSVDTYHLPKGHVGVDESLEVCAIRETREEAGVQVSIKTYLGALHSTYRLNKSIDKIIHYFAASWKSNFSEIDSEHSNALWVDIEAAAQLLGSPNPKQEDEIIRRFKKFMEVSK